MNLMKNGNKPISFTGNEVAVTWFFMTGMTMKQIAEWSGIPEKSVSYYKRRVMKKIGAENNNELIMWFLENRHDYKENLSEMNILIRRIPTSRNG